jgi:hypothetical protein
MTEESTTTKSPVSKPMSQSRRGMYLLVIFIGTLCFLGIILPFAITSVVLGTLDGECDNTDKMNLNVSKYLLGYGITAIIMNSISVFIYLMLRIHKNDFYKTISYWLNLIDGGFLIAWTVVGGIILFRSNIDCIHAQYPYVCFAVFIWVMSIVNIGCRTKIVFKSPEEITTSA